TVGSAAVAVIPAPRPSPAPAPVTAPAVVQLGAAPAPATLVRAYEETWRGIVEAQSTYQRVMADTHMAFLRTVETSFVAYSGGAIGQPAGVVSDASFVTYAPLSAAPAPVAAPAPL